MYRRYAMLIYIIRVLWEYIHDEAYPLSSLPDWAVHYMARYLYDDELGGWDEQLLDNIVSLSQAEWEIRHKDRKIWKSYLRYMSN